MSLIAFITLAFLTFILGIVLAEKEICPNKLLGFAWTLSILSYLVKPLFCFMCSLLSFCLLFGLAIGEME